MGDCEAGLEPCRGGLANGSASMDGAGGRVGAGKGRARLGHVGVGDVRRRHRAGEIPPRAAAAAF